MPCFGEREAAAPAQLRWRRLPIGLEDVSTYPALVAELLARNWTEEELKAALAENLLRVFKKVEEVSRARGCTGHGDTQSTGTQGAAETSRTRGCTAPWAVW